MWALVENNEVTRVFATPKPFTVNDVQYSQSVFYDWETANLNAIGIYEIQQDLTNFKDERYYINGTESFTFADNTVTRSFATATARNLDPIYYAEGDFIPPTNEVGDMKDKGLKLLHKEDVNNKAQMRLYSTDWYIIRNLEASTAIPDNISTFRTNVRATSNSMCDKIDAVTTVDELAALYQYGEDGTRPLGEFPKL